MPRPERVFELTPPPTPEPADPRRPRKHLPGLVHEHARASVEVPLDQAPFPEVYTLAVEVLADVNRRTPPGTDPQEAAKRQATALCHYLGGRRFWWPTPGRIASLVRDWTLYHHEYSGRNAAELAKRHRMPLETLYRVLKRMRQYHLRALRRGRVPLEGRANQHGVSGQRRDPTG